MARKEPIVTNKVAPSRALLSHAMRVEGSHWPFCSGQLGIDPETGALVEGTEARTARHLLPSPTGCPARPETQCGVENGLPKGRGFNPVYRR